MQYSTDEGLTGNGHDVGGGGDQHEHDSEHVVEHDHDAQIHDENDEHDNDHEVVEESAHGHERDTSEEHVQQGIVKAVEYQHNDSLPFDSPCTD